MFGKLTSPQEIIFRNKENIYAERWAGFKFYNVRKSLVIKIEGMLW